ncbi:CHAT domain-containing protein [Streptomyces sp. NPDC047886]|uniref:CHAT domain-containing protein n=1 Tax=Streptomyces sp. NPDC047886 TaxID=3365490 RepID=UPI003711CB08
MWSRRGNGPRERIDRGVRKYLRTGRTAAVAGDGLTADAARLLRDAGPEPPGSPGRRQAFQLAGWLYLCRAELFVRRNGLPDFSGTVTLVGLLHDTDPDALPPGLWELAVEFGADPESRVKAARAAMEVSERQGLDPVAGLTALHRAVTDLPADHPQRAEAHLFLAAAWLERHEGSGDPDDVERAVAAGRTALRLSTSTSAARPLLLYTLCVALTRRLSADDTAENARAAVEMCRKLLAVAPDGGTEQCEGRQLLGEALTRRHDHGEAADDLDEAVEVLRTALDDCRRAGDVQAVRLRSLTVALYRRYRRTDSREDLAEALRVLREAVRVAERAEPARAASLRAELVALEREAAAGRPGRTLSSAPRPAPPPAPERAERARVLIERAETEEDPLARDRGIESLGAALRDLPQGFADRVPYTALLATALHQRYRSGGGDPVDLDASEELAREALRLCPEGDPNRAQCLLLLGATAEVRHERAGGAREQLDAAVDTYHRLLGSGVATAWHRRQALRRLGRNLAERSRATGSLPDLDEAVDALRQALEAPGAPRAEYGSTALDLAAALLLREERTGAAHELDEARERLLAALRVLSADDPLRRRADALLAEVTRRRERHRAWREDAVAPVLRRTHVVPGQQDRPEVPPEDAGRTGGSTVVHQYGHVLAELARRFADTGDATALERGVDIGRRVLGGMPDDHPERAAICRDLGVLLLRRFEHAGDRRDIDAAVEHLRYGAYGPLSLVQQFRNALGRPDASLEELRQAGGEDVDTLLRLGSDRGRELSALAAAHVVRFGRDGSAADLDEAVAAARRAVEATPAHHRTELRTRLETLAVVLVTRYRHTGDPGDLDRAIELGRRVLGTLRVSLTTGTWSESVAETRRITLANLCNRLRARYLLTGSAADLEEAIGLGREAVALGRGGRASAQDRVNLALALADRAALRGDTADLRAAIDEVEAAADALPPSSPRYARSRLLLGSLLRDRSEAGASRARERDASRALALFREAAEAALAAPQERLDGAVAWGRFAAERAVAGRAGWEEAADGFAAAVSLLPLTAWRGLGRADRERLLAPRSHLTTEAAACAVCCGRLEQAVELLDQGRSVLWGQALDTRTDLTALRAAHPELAERLDTVRSGLDATTTIDATDARADARAGGPPGARAGGPPGDPDGERQRRLAREWEELLAEVRRLPGFAGFLLPLPFAELSRATADGPMIIVNVSRYRCDALVVTPGRVRLVPLPGLTADEAQRRTERYLAALDRLDRPGAAPGPAQQTVLATLEWLWDTVAAPVLDSPDAAGWEGGRVWWCATGPLALLPVHAAGYHDPDDGRERDAVLARVVSSYMPTLRGLLRARRPVAPPDQVRRLLILALGDRPPYAPDLAPLPGARQEAESLRRRFPGRHTVRLDSEATYEGALGLLPTHTCVHFACHAGQDLADPGRGALYLYDRPLKVTDLARLDLETPELAVLSACQTALGGRDLPNEAIHLAAALLLGGFRHVVSTLWTVGDDSARGITEEMYEVLGDAHGRLHPSRTARALHEAVDRARRRDPFRPLAWAAHVHFGP